MSPPPNFALKNLQDPKLIQGAIDPRNYLGSEKQPQKGSDLN